jgi:hypothetical protein
MNANQEPRPNAQGSNQEDPPLQSNRKCGVYSDDAEQVRRDLFRDAVQQALAKQARASKGKRGRDAQAHCTELLTSNELKFLLNQDV